MSLQLTLPVYVDHYRGKSGPGAFRARPLLLPDGTLEESAPREDRALSLLAGQLRRSLQEAITQADHRDLQPWTFCPPLSGHSMRLRIELRRKSFEGRFFVAVFESHGARIAVLPRGPGLSFEWPEGTRLEDVTQRVITEHLRKLEKDSAEEIDTERWCSGTQPHLTHLNLLLHGNQRIPEPPTRFLSLGADRPMDGAVELHKVGRCLDLLYPKELQRAMLREDELRELLAWFGRKMAHPPMVLLVGRPKSGKTALVHECVRRRMELPTAFKRGQFWQVAPQRVISGMMYLGQWEERWTAMLAEMRKQRHVLVLDDLPGLFEAGKSSGSDLTLGHVLKARQEHEPLAILAEATPEAWGRLREIDRAFASLFQVIHLREMGDDSTLRILVRTLQQLEADSSVRFAPEVLPLVMRMQLRFNRARAFPGKAVEMMHALASSYGEGGGHPAAVCVGLQADYVLLWFAQRHGLRLAMIDSAQELTRASLEEFFSERIMGQHAAVRAMIDMVLMARTEVHDARRPLGSLLCLGPTGVGKTECARALAEFVFGSEERMVRFDLNEYSGSDAAVRLIGGPGQGGLLTSRVRRQPFCLLLFDEVEKAHPDVFDLLLQVLGEGRLTDAQGQTVDFCNCMIILTSNLGAQNARRRLGFEEADVEDQQVYRDAAEKFFRPEFFNRLDRIVPFHELRKEDIEHLAARLTARAMERQGLRDRRVELLCDPDVLQLLARHGFDREYGARALRRAVESHLVEPLATQLLTWPAGKSMRVQVSVTADGTLAFAPEIHRQAPRQATLPTSLSGDELLDSIDNVHTLLDASEKKLDGWSFDGEEGISARHAWYYRLRDVLARYRHQIKLAEDAVEGVARARRKAAASRSATPFHEPVDDDLRVMPPKELEGLVDRLLGGSLSERGFEETFAKAVPMTRSTGRVLRLLWRARWLASLCDESQATPQECTLRQEPLGGQHWCSVVPFWDPADFLDDRRGADNGVVLEGRGLEPLVRYACSGSVRYDKELFIYTVSSDSAPPSTDIARLIFGRSLLDLRTGLVASWFPETLDLALALAFTDPS